jgi:hypothetical protein
MDLFCFFTEMKNSQEYDKYLLTIATDFIFF